MLKFANNFRVEYVNIYKNLVAYLAKYHNSIPGLRRAASCNPLWHRQRVFGEENGLLM